MPLNTSTSLSRVPPASRYNASVLLLHALHCNKDHHGNTTDFFFFFSTYILCPRCWLVPGLGGTAWLLRTAEVRRRLRWEPGRLAGRVEASRASASFWREDETSAETHDPRRIHLPPERERETQGHRGLSPVGTSELTFTCNNYVSEQWQQQRLKVAAKFLLACTALCQCGDVIECPLNSWDERVQTHTHSYTHI